MAWKTLSQHRCLPGASTAPSRCVPSLAEAAGPVRLVCHAVADRRPARGSREDDLEPSQPRRRLFDSARAEEAPQEGSEQPYVQQQDSERRPSAPRRPGRGGRGGAPTRPARSAWAARPQDAEQDSAFAEDELQGSQQQEGGQQRWARSWQDGGSGDAGEEEEQQDDGPRRRGGRGGSRSRAAPNPLERGRRRLGTRSLEQEGADGAQAGDQEGRRGGEQRQVKAPPPLPKLPSVRPLTDVPVVRPGDTDKGTFFAPQMRFDELGLSKDVIDALRTLGIKRPSHVQAAALQAWQSDAQHLVVADQAGSGKTLAYLLPLVQAIRAQDQALGKPGTQPRCPRAVVVAPTVELVQQIYRVARALSDAGARMRVAAMTGGQSTEAQRSKSLRTQRELLSGLGVDLLVATPGMLQAHLKSGHLELSMCRGLVLDEVDVLLGDTAAFEAQITPLREAAPPSLRFFLVTATLPQHTADALRATFKDMALASGPGLHRTAAGLVEELVDCSGGEDVSLETGVQRKLDGLEQVLARHKAPRTLVFCNKIESCRAVENALRRNFDPAQVQVLVYHEAIREDLRQAAMNAFLAPAGKEGESLAHLDKFSGKLRVEEVVEEALDDDAKAADATARRSRQQRPQPARDDEEDIQDMPAAPAPAADGPPRLVLVATDRMSRGIDCMNCNHVVLFDFPRDPSEYVRRVGRTARGAGGTGVVSSLVLGRQVALAREIMGRNEKGQPVHRLPRI